jgi:triosephosphate isomerase (TIM)
MKPLIIVNFKAYDEASGSNAVQLAKVCGRVAKEIGASIFVAPALVDLGLVANIVDCFGQHVDVVSAGAFTGHVTAAGLKKVGAVGSLINHSERQVTIYHVKEAVDICREHGLTSVVCVSSLDKIKEVLDVCAPDYVAYEPPELIGGDISVTSAEPEIVEQAVKLVNEKTSSVKVLCGAGVKNGEDVKAALKLGCVGVLVASGVVKAEDSENVLRELVRG